MYVCDPMGKREREREKERVSGIYISLYLYCKTMMSNFCAEYAVLYVDGILQGAGNRVEKRTGLQYVKLYVIIHKEESRAEGVKGKQKLKKKTSNPPQQFSTSVVVGGAYGQEEANGCCTCHSRPLQQLWSFVANEYGGVGPETVCPSAGFQGVVSPDNIVEQQARGAMTWSHP